MHVSFAPRFTGSLWTVQAIISDAINNTLYATMKRGSIIIPVVTGDLSGIQCVNRETLRNTKRCVVFSFFFQFSIEVAELGYAIPLRLERIIIIIRAQRARE